MSSGFQLCACAIVAAVLSVVDLPVAWGASVYAPSGWASLHQSEANRRSQPVDLPTQYRSWTALQGAATLTVPTVGPDGHLYATTGQGRGHSNLHAFTLDGALLWQAKPMENMNDLDGCAILSSPIVDREGDVYISDCNQLWSFKPDGKVKWVVDLPAAPAGAHFQRPDFPINAFTTAVFTKDGDVLGVTNFGQVVVVDRATGKPRADVVRLPGLIPPKSTKYPLRDAILGFGLMDPGLRDWAWQLIFGGEMNSANTPAVDMRTGRIFVAVSSVAPGRGVLMGFDLKPRSDGKLTVEIAFSSDMGPGSGSSPTLSPDGRFAYVSDDDGMFYAFDTANGKRAWTVQTKAAAGAAAVGEDGTIVALQEVDAFAIAIDPNGHRLWESDIGNLVKAALPSRWYLGGPVARSTGNPVIVKGMVLEPVVYCYTLGWGKWRIPIPIRSAIVAIDMKTGKGIKEIVGLSDDSSGITAVLPDGTIINSLGSVLTSAVEPLAWLMNRLLPGPLKQLEARGGIQVSRPVRASKDAM
ncbi:PQQ-binding-like beta-propeller repeat protein [Denitratisoma sp. DHT3]|uniref:outer membrane protein assembly factor BamB family protein n=1 Tax=Denitratisoma sp. DHT3 TaxID=1981880 RepID=UPI0016493F33|nr:PQQ-binding-like beta-propeller repeat protein [Denitratisoma sp. DHT3]